MPDRPNSFLLKYVNIRPVAYLLYYHSKRNRHRGHRQHPAIRKNDKVNVFLCMVLDVVLYELYYTIIYYIQLSTVETPYFRSRVDVYFSHARTTVLCRWFFLTETWTRWQNSIITPSHGVGGLRFVCREHPVQRKSGK